MLPLQLTAVRFNRSHNSHLNKVIIVTFICLHLHPRASRDANASGARSSPTEMNRDAEARDSAVSSRLICLACYSGPTRFRTVTVVPADGQTKRYAFFALELADAVVVDTKENFERTSGNIRYSATTKLSQNFTFIPFILASHQQ